MKTTTRGPAQRLRAKTVEETIIARIQQDFNLAPFLARTLFAQMRQYFQEFFNLAQEPGKITYCALAADVPPGVSFQEKDCRRIPVVLTLDTPSDLELLHEGKGVMALRRVRLMRMAQEALEQGGLLTQEDLARLLNTSVRTIRRDLVALQQQDLVVPLRGRFQDIGRGVSHKAKIVELYLKGYTFTEIKDRTHHGSAAVKQYLQDFTRVAYLKARGLSTQEIRVATRLSERLIEEYLALLERARGDAAMEERLQEVLSPPLLISKLPPEQPFAVGSRGDGDGLGEGGKGGREWTAS